MEVWRGTIAFVPPLDPDARALVVQPEQMAVDPPVAFALDW